jgi:hypothetical protein
MNDEVKTVNLTFDINSVNIILAGLGKLPLEGALPVFESIHKQVNGQMQPTPEGPLKDKIVKG